MALLDMRAGRGLKEQGYGDNDVDVDTHLVGKISVGKVGPGWEDRHGQGCLRDHPKARNPSVSRIPICAA